MRKRVMKRQASDNEYLHRDFHGAMSVSLDYLARRWGEDAAAEFLRQFATNYYKPVREDLEARGLLALKEYLEGIYDREGGIVQSELSENELVVRVERCPAICHMRENEYPVAHMFCLSTRVVNEALCEGSPYQADMPECDPQAGRCVMRFFRR